MESNFKKVIVLIAVLSLISLQAFAGLTSSNVQYIDGQTPPPEIVGTVPIFENSSIMEPVSNVNGLPVNIISGGGSGGTASNFNAAFPGTGTAIGASDGANMKPVLVDASGFLKVNVAAGSGGNGAASNTGSAVPTQADYTGINVGGTLVGQTGVQPKANIYAADLNLESIVDETPAMVAAGTLKVGIVDSSGVNLTSTSNALDMNIKSGSIANTGFNVNNAPSVKLQDGAGNNITSTTSALDVNLKTSAITEQTTNLTQVNGYPLLTASNGIAKVGLTDGSGTVLTSTGSALDVNLKTSAITEQSVNVAQIAAYAPNVNSGAVGNGTQRVVVADNFGKTIVNVSGTTSTSGDHTLVSADASNKIKVFALALTTTSTTENTIKFTDGAGGTELWRYDLQAISGGNVGANLAVTPPAFLFANSAVNTALVLNTSQAVAIHYSISYYKDAT